MGEAAQEINSLDVNTLSNLRIKAEQDLAQVSNKVQLEDVRKTWLSKDGLVRQLFTRLREVDPQSKAQVAQEINSMRDLLEQGVLQKEQQLTQKQISSRLKEEFFDCSLPSTNPGFGRVNAITSVERTIANVLKPFGFRTVVGPEIESEYFCFDALNIPKHHPARDMQDTFFTDTGHVVRTHTTSVQSRELQKGELPVKIATFGRSYRNETEDASHQAMFHQFELVWLDKGLTLANLQALMAHILKALYGKRRKVRFVPKFYPYTEPSVGPQIDCIVCSAKGCPACGHAGWVTVGGSGMIHRNVLLEFKYNPDEVSGFAFGLGTSRLAAQILAPGGAGIPNLKLLYNNDLQLLKGK